MNHIFYYLKEKIAFLLVLTLLASCKGETGAVGPKGDIGATGLKGDTGATGAAGVNGTNGSTTIIYSDWISPTATNWTKINDIQYTYTINEAKITADILNKGIIMVYARTPNTTTVMQLPMTLTGATNLQVYEILSSVGKIMINFKEIIDITATPANYQFRYVVIPSGSTSGRINYANYEAVKQLYNLKD